MVCTNLLPVTLTFLLTLCLVNRPLGVFSTKTVTETLAPMMNAMRMIWIISRHYNTDELMVPLMSRIAWELCERVVRVVNVSTLFKLEASTIKKITSSAVTMLDTWKSSYLFIRAKIETSGRGIRWEFDRRKLFDRTEYMAIICKDLHDMAQVIEEFLNIFSQELKNVTGDAERIDEVVDQVYELVEPIMQLPYDIFSPVRASSWNNLKVKFYKRVKEIEQTAKVFIDDSFQSLRSSEGAFELLMKLKNIKSRETVNQRMQSKFRNVIMQFNKEVESTAAIFMENKVKPPVFRNYPPVSGSIYWERFLVHRIKSSIIHFQSMQEMMSTDLGKMATHKYLTTAKSMRKYELQVAGMWSEAVERLLNQYLSCPLITKSDASPADLEGRFSDSEELAQLEGRFSDSEELPQLEAPFSDSEELAQLEGRFSDSEELAQTNPADLEGRFSDSEELAQLEGRFSNSEELAQLEAPLSDSEELAQLEGRFSHSEELAQLGSFFGPRRALSAWSYASSTDLEDRFSDSNSLLSLWDVSQTSSVCPTDLEDRFLDSEELAQLADLKGRFSDREDLSQIVPLNYRFVSQTQESFLNSSDATPADLKGRFSDSEELGQPVPFSSLSPFITKSDASPPDLDGRFSDSVELPQLVGRFSDLEELPQFEGRYLDSQELAQLREISSFSLSLSLYLFSSLSPLSTKSDASPADLEGRFSDSEELA
ncbi:hypothetical protein RRG08_045979 [Elysia crispata]|uniref:Dynein heavy chain tail domain-containing protein n=1 Tax=Elysia crispata TaxID=231223 RepID=A0AAE1ARA9_9GAST|nr:hypothetical protein RRG08_045979 [Elysia crispata]